MKHKKYLKFLANQAIDQEEVGRAKVAALIVYKNMPIALGKNSLKSHPIQAMFGRNSDAVYLHAEIDAIIKALKEISLEELKKSTLYISRILRDGTCGLSRPCTGCQKAIKAFGIEKIVWTTYNGFTTSELENVYEDHKLCQIEEDSRKSNNKSLHLSAFRRFSYAR